MSYDLMMFDPKAAPTDRVGYERWYDVVTRWGEGHDYNDPRSSSPRLLAWFRAMTPRFPALNGPFRSRTALWFQPDHVTDYSCAKHAIYAGFRWNDADPAYRATFVNAEKLRLGLYDVSSERGEVWLPTGIAGFALAHVSRW